MIYFDHHAATPPSHLALQAMHEAEKLGWANPSSVHQAGQRARALLEKARSQIATALGAASADIVLTAGGTEACNLGLIGLAGFSPKHVIVSAIEHPAVSATATRWHEQGSKVTRLPVPQGIPPSAEQLAALITAETELVAIQWVNHECGSIFPIADYAEVCKEKKLPFFVDATQAVGKIPVSIEKLPISALACASHKIGGPCGAGALYIRRDAPFTSLLEGGSQERGRRPGSHDVIAAVGFGAAMNDIENRLAAMQEVRVLRDDLEAHVKSLGAHINAEQSKRVPTVCNASFPDLKGELLVAALDIEGLCVSGGSACTSGLSTGSAILRAMYPEEAWRSENALRMSLAPITSRDEVQSAKALLSQVIERMQQKKLK
ncbi:MAG: cysteine desulfurase [Myxococcales bacterium]|nr:MAG: cysteine desulfurase [Myxococcales bacterium]